MLNSLTIKNVAVIDSLNIDFHNGMTVLTGETGAGKSIIIDSINMISGDRASREIVRYGADKAVVQAVFDIPTGIRDTLEDNGIDTEDEQLIITRQLTAEGKSTARINGTVVTLGLLREISDNLINIHGQHDNQALLTPARHVAFLDAYAACGRELEEYRNILSQKRDTEKKLASLKMDEQEKIHRTDLLEYQINEIKSAKLEKDEEESLREQRDIYSNAGQIQAAVDKAYQNIYGGDELQSAYDGMSIAVEALSEISELNPKLKTMYDSLNSAMYTIEDTAHDLKEFGDSIEYDEQELNDIEERLDLISRLKRKYGNSIVDVLAYLKKAEEELSDIQFSDEKSAQLAEEIDSLTENLKTAGEKLSKKRKDAATVLEKQIEGALHELNMEKTAFCVSVENSGEFYDDGMNKVEFLIRTNPGEPLKPLVKVASGGELSRVMLAIKSILADTDGVGTLIFDEIDTGVSGRAAVAISDKLKAIGRGRQVICISHLPQLAAAADNHYLIEKDTDGDMARTTLTELDSAGRETELARIIDGREASALAIEHAKEMLKDARERDGE